MKINSLIVLFGSMILLSQANDAQPFIGGHYPYKLKAGARYVTQVRFYFPKDSVSLSLRVDSLCFYLDRTGKEKQRINYSDRDSINLTIQYKYRFSKLKVLHQYTAQGTFYSGFQYRYFLRRLKRVISYSNLQTKNKGPFSYRIWITVDFKRPKAIAINKNLIHKYRCFHYNFNGKLIQEVEKNAIMMTIDSISYYYPESNKVIEEHHEDRYTWSYTSIYDSCGRLLQRFKGKSPWQREDLIIFEYDKFSNLSESRHYGYSEYNVPTIQKFQYQYDYKGNWIKCSYYLNNKLESITLRNIQYY